MDENPASNPYKGPLSYEIEDEDYFFGRDREAALLTAKILSSRFTLLHAQSGTGKTSLLNARVTPALEKQSWTPFRILPRLNPTEAVRVGVLLGLLPHPSAEVAALDRVLAQFHGGRADPTIEDLLRHFDHDVPTSDPRRREVLQPVDTVVELKWAGLSFSGKVRPLFLRLLRATLEVSQYCEHLQSMLPHAPQVKIREDTRIGELRNTLIAPATAKAHEELLGALYIPVPSLREFFANLIETYGKMRSQFGLVLIMDQFEELFTLFSHSLSAPEKQLWRLRWEFIDQLEELYETGAGLPIRFVISMRDEYIAQLDAIRRFVRDLDASAFHLSFLEKEEARAAIQNPANLFGYGYTEDCYDNIFKVLLREDRFVEPAPLQIVCERLWQQQGKSLSKSAAGTPRLVEFASFPEGGTRAILDEFFEDAINSLEPEDRLETLEMLDPLVTLSRTRNIVERSSLVSPPFRKAERRAKLLENLAEKRIVRIEHRLGGQFVEITHEFLIESILSKIRTVLNADPQYTRYRWAIRMLERFEDVDFRAGSRYVPDVKLFNDLNAKREDIEWTPLSIELMFRSSMVTGAEPDVIRFWAQKYSEVPSEESVANLLSEERIREQVFNLLSMDELRSIRLVNAQDLSVDQVEFVLRSYIKRAEDSARDQIVAWTQKMETACQAEKHS